MTAACFATIIEVNDLEARTISGAKFVLVSIPPIEYDEFQKSSQFIEGVSTIFGKDNPLEGE